MLHTITMQGGVGLRSNVTYYYKRMGHQISRIEYHVTLDYLLNIAVSTSLTYLGLVGLGRSAYCALDKKL